MSRNMRPEVRRWGSVAGVFVGADAAIDLLAAVSRAEPEIAMNCADEVSHDVYRVRWEDGVGILRRFEALDDAAMRTAISEVEELRKRKLTPKVDARTFLSNLRASATEWKSFLDPDDGSLELLIDA